MTQQTNIPLIIKLPKSEKAGPGVDGQSLQPLLRGEKFVFRRGEIHVEIGGGDDPFHAPTDGPNKYIWFSLTGREQFFDLVHDPRELQDLSQSRSGEVASWRDRLNRILNGWHEGFVEAGWLTAARKHFKLCPP